jgi:hypothetical protein
MKYIVTSICALALFACGQKTQQQAAGKELVYGQAVDSSKAVSIDAALSEFEKNGKAEAVVSGNISAVCKGEGCWFSIKAGNADVYAEFDEKFTIAKDCAGKNTIASGRFYRDTTGIDDLKKEAKEEGKTQAEIDAINAPKVVVQFKASGVVIK